MKNRYSVTGIPDRPVNLGGCVIKKTIDARRKPFLNAALLTAGAVLLSIATPAQAEGKRGPDVTSKYIIENICDYSVEDLEYVRGALTNLKVLKKHLTSKTLLSRGYNKIYRRENSTYLYKLHRKLNSNIETIYKGSDDLFSSIYVKKCVNENHQTVIWDIYFTENEDWRLEEFEIYALIDSDDPKWLNKYGDIHIYRTNTNKAIVSIKVLGEKAKYNEVIKFFKNIGMVPLAEGNWEDHKSFKNMNNLKNKRQEYIEGFKFVKNYSLLKDRIYGTRLGNFVATFTWHENSLILRNIKADPK